MKKEKPSSQENNLIYELPGGLKGPLFRKYGRPISATREKTIARAVSNRQLDLTLIMEELDDPHNISAAARSAEAVGIDTIHIIQPEGRRHTLGKRSASSAKKWIKLKYYRSVETCVAALREQGYTIFSTHLSEASVSLYDCDLKVKAAIAIGNEKRGCSEALYLAADFNMVIPIMGMVQSLNVSVAAAVILFEAMRQRIEAGMYEQKIPGNAELEQRMLRYLEM